MLDPLLRDWDGEQLDIRRDGETGSWVLIGIHSTVLGPAAGGTRMKPYPDIDAALADVLRLSQGMTYKFATPGLPFGGGKAVLMVPPDLDPAHRDDLLRRYGQMVADLGGRFLTGPDVGTSPRDMDVIADTAGPHVFCRTPEAGGAGDPGPYTALGVYTAIQATCEQLGRRLDETSIVVQGAGDVGGPLIKRLVDAGATVAFSEIDEGLIRRFRDDLGVELIDPDDAVAAPCDVFAPCALGGVLDSDSIPRLRCRAVAGSANNQLGRPGDAELLRERGILYAPDFVANVGGAMAIPGIEALGWPPDRATKEVADYVLRTLHRVFATAQSEGIATDAAAVRLAEQRLRDAGAN